MKLFQYPKLKSKLKVRARNLSISNKRIIKNFIKTSKRISNHGIFILGHEVNSFESKIKNFLDIKNAVAVNSGTSAIYLALKILNLKKNDEIITTPMSWLVTSTSILLAGGKPVFADVDSNYNLDPNSVINRITKKTKAIVVTHFYGKVAQVDKLKKISKKYNLILIEDSAQAFGASLKKIKAGTYGDIGTFSFSPMKVFGSFGNAGVIVFKNKDFLNKLISLRTCGTVNREICQFPELKFDIDPIHAAHIKENFNVYNFLKRKRLSIAKRYYINLSDQIENLPKVEREYNHTFYDFTVLVENRKKVIKYFYEKGIEAKVRHPILINKQPVFKNLKKVFLPKAEFYVDKILSLPMHYNLKNSEIDYVCENLIKAKNLFR